MLLEDHHRRPTLLRWTDYLTGRSCTLRIADTDIGSSVAQLASRYLTDVDTRSLADDGVILSDHATTLMEIQDVSHVISEEGALLTLAPGTVFRDGVRELSPHETPRRAAARVRDSEVGLIDLTIDRSETGYTRNWQGFNLRRWERSSSDFQQFVEASVRHWCTSGSDEVLALDEHRSRIRLLEAISRSIWEAPFENYSRFTGSRLRYKTGDEALSSIIAGQGAICSEKVQALKFLTDRFGFESHYVLAGPDTPGLLPVDQLRHILDTFDFRGAGPAMRFWQHMALEIVVDNERVFVDATNGNIPFMFVRGAEVDHILHAENPKPVTVRMGTYSEQFYYHRAPAELARDLCYAMENFIPEIDLVQVFDNELGLAITPEFLVAPLPYSSDSDFSVQSNLIRELAGPNNLAFHADREWRLDSEVGAQFHDREECAAEKVLDSYEHLAERYNLFEDEQYEMGLVVVRLVPD